MDLSKLLAEVTGLFAVTGFVTAIIFSGNPILCLFAFIAVLALFCVRYYLETADLHLPEGLRPQLRKVAALLAFILVAIFLYLFAPRMPWWATVLVGLGGAASLNFVYVIVIQGFFNNKSEPVLPQVMMMPNPSPPAPAA